MTPKEKAKELMISFGFLEYNQKTGHKIKGKNDAFRKSLIKQCCLLCIEEIINCDGEQEDGFGWSIIPYNDFDNKFKEYWKEVKSAINEL